MAEIDKWFNVNEDARIWSGHADSATRLGWLRAPAGIRAIDDYKGSYQFKEVRVADDGRDEIVIKSGYPQNWIRHEDVTTEPFEEPTNGEPGLHPDDPAWVPVPVTGDAELGAAVRTIVAFVSSYFR